MFRVIAHLPTGEKVATFIRPPGKVGRFRDAAGPVAAAGIIYTTPDYRVLLLKRAPGEVQGGTWGLPAGGLGPGETPRFGARREAREELGGVAPPGDLLLLGTSPLPSGARFAVFWQEVEEEFKPKLNSEHTDYQWADLTDLPDGLHPGMEDLLSMGALGRKVLAHELVEFLQAKAATTKDDAPVGHPFYGNQYTDVVLGPKPTEAKAKVAKHAVHELLSSGHPWTVEELAKITGHQNMSTLKSWLSMFKSEKTAGSKGALNVQKNPDGTYQVVKANGQPAEPVPMPAAPEPPVPEVKEAPQEAAQNDPGATIAPAPEPPSTPAAPEALQVDLGAGYVASPHPGGALTKAEADAHYQAHLSGLLGKIAGQVHGMSETGAIGDLGWKKLAQNFKQGKANAMAKWAALTQGKEMKAKPVDVFPQDIELVKALGKAHDDPEAQKAAFEQWKKETTAAKHAPKIADPPPAAAPAAPSPEPAKVEPAPAELQAPASEEEHSVFKAPEHLVPPGHVQISADDFSSKPGLGSSPFVSGLSKLKKGMEAVSTNAVGNKQAIQQKLTELLHASKEFQAVRDAVQKKYGSAGGYAASAEARLISSWAASSGDHLPLSVAAQLAIRDAFKMPADSVETKAFHYLQSKSEEQTYHDAAAELGFETKTHPEQLKQFKKALRDFALAQYHATQDFFKAQGLSEVYLVRGMKVSSNGVEHVKLKLQPASSFSTNYSTAHSFAGQGGAVYVCRVPVSQILGSYLTGYGCTNEHEVVVLNHHQLEAITVPSNQASSATAANATIHASAHKLKSAAGGWAAPDIVKKSSGAAAGTIGGGAHSSPKGWTTLAKELPTKPPGAKSSHLKTMIAAAKKKDAVAFEAAYDLLKTQAKTLNIPKSMAYGHQLAEKFDSLVELHNSQPAAAPAGTAKSHGVSHVFGTPVEKTASFYQKLKKAVVSHPAYHEEAYKALKDAGATNEHVYQVFQNFNAWGPEGIKGIHKGLQESGTPISAPYIAVYSDFKKKGLLP